MKKTIALFLCVALALSFSTPVTAGEAASLSVSTAAEKVEVISKRDVYSKTYLLPDGSYQYVSYAEPIHYKDKTGSYTEIDNKISDAVKAEGYKYTNTANMWNAYFSEKLGTPDAVKMTDGTHQISFSFLRNNYLSIIRGCPLMIVRSFIRMLWIRWILRIRFKPVH